ncbi:hypothetical protein V8G54_029775 [Vigna mungo]|uniref:PGG domain-containing protein n=1 Tax=Vigna mungo TaxID=3915 RepID=A0AAQ3MVF3_VIGMU
MLLVEDDVAKEVMVVNPVNERGMTPLDVLMLFQSEAGDLEIYRSLVKAGAKSGKDIENENEAGRIRQPLEVEIVHETHVPPRNCTDEESILPKITEEFIELFRYKPNRDSTNDVRNILLTVAALMITATYQAVLSPPGGVWQEDSYQHSAGKSILATKSRGTFLWFILGNSIGFYTSFHMIIQLTSGFPLQYILVFLTSCMSFNYSASMIYLVPDRDLICYRVTLVCVVSGYLSLSVPNLLIRILLRAQK